MSLKQWQVKILVALATTIICLVVVELGLRFLGIEYPLFYDYDPYLGNKLRPGVKGYWLDEGGGYVSIDSDGLRDHEHPINHPPDTLRIAILGDSYAEAKQVNENEAFWAIMGKKLQECDSLRGRKVEVINFGVSGFGTAQELLTLRHKVWKYHPDVILLAVTTANDISDNSRTLKQIDYHPYFVYQGNTLVLDDRKTRENWEEKQHSLWRRFCLDDLLNFRVFQLIHHSKDLLEEWWSHQDSGKKGSPPVKGLEAGINPMVYREPTTKAWQEAWRVTEGILLLMRDEVAQHKAQFFVVTLTNGPQVDPSVSNRTAFDKSLGVRDLFYPDHRLEGFCQSHHIPILLLAPDFQKYATQHQVYLHGFGKNLGTGHWNQNGHRLAGQTIAKWLCPQLTDPGQSGHQGAS